LTTLDLSWNNSKGAPQGLEKAKFSLYSIWATISKSRLSLKLWSFPSEFSNAVLKKSLNYSIDAIPEMSWWTLSTWFHLTLVKINWKPASANTED
jgi:hypothetical protein